MATEQVFAKTAATRRVRELIKTQWPKTLGYKIEIQRLDGYTYSLRSGLGASERVYGAEFRVMKSTCGSWAELQDMFRMTIGSPTEPAKLIK